LGILGRPDPVRRLLRSEIMPPRHVRYHRTGAIASATIRPFSSSLHRRRRTTPVTSAWRRTIFVSSLPIFVAYHNVHMILDPNSIAIVHCLAFTPLWGKSTANFVGVVLFWAVHKYEHDRRLAFFLELLVVGLGFAAILRQLLR
jgi:hypothetical protein